MVFDKITGEILSESSDGKPYDSPKFIVDCKSNDEIAELFKDDSKGRVLWTNASNDALRKHLTPESRHHFESFCQSIPSRNYIFVKASEMCKNIGITRKYFYSVLDEWVQVGLLKIIKRDVVSKGNHLYVVNPTVVWKGYVQSGTVDYEDHIGYSSTYRFSHSHKIAVNYWVDMYITGFYNTFEVEL